MHGREPEAYSEEMTLKRGHSLDELENISHQFVEDLRERVSISTVEELIAQWHSQGVQLAKALDVSPDLLQRIVLSAERHVDPAFVERVKKFRPTRRSYGARSPYSSDTDEFRSRRQRD
jgi:hypothetical protein